MLLPSAIPWADYCIRSHTKLTSRWGRSQHWWQESACRYFFGRDEMVEGGYRGVWGQVVADEGRLGSGRW